MEGGKWKVKKIEPSQSEAARFIEMVFLTKALFHSCALGIEEFVATLDEDLTIT